MSALESHCVDCNKTCIISLWNFIFCRGAYKTTIMTIIFQTQTSFCNSKPQNVNTDLDRNAVIIVFSLFSTPFLPFCNVHHLYVYGLVQSFWDFLALHFEFWSVLSFCFVFRLFGHFLGIFWHFFDIFGNFLVIFLTFLSTPSIVLECF